MQWQSPLQQIAAWQSIASTHRARPSFSPTKAREMLRGQGRQLLLREVSQLSLQDLMALAVGHIPVSGVKSGCQCSGIRRAVRALAILPHAVRFRPAGWQNGATTVVCRSTAMGGRSNRRRLQCGDGEAPVVHNIDRRRATVDCPERSNRLSGVGAIARQNGRARQVGPVPRADPEYAPQFYGEVSASVDLDLVDRVWHRFRATTMLPNPPEKALCETFAGRWAPLAESTKLRLSLSANLSTVAAQQIAGHLVADAEAVAPALKRLDAELSRLRRTKQRPVEPQSGQRSGYVPKTSASIQQHKTPSPARTIASC